MSIYGYPQQPQPYGQPLQPMQQPMQQPMNIHPQQYTQHLFGQCMNILNNLMMQQNTNPQIAQIITTSMSMNTNDTNAQRNAHDFLNFVVNECRRRGADPFSPNGVHVGLLSEIIGTWLFRTANDIIQQQTRQQPNYYPQQGYQQPSGVISYSGNPQYPNQPSGSMYDRNSPPMQQPPQVIYQPPPARVESRPSASAEPSMESQISIKTQSMNTPPEIEESLREQYIETLEFRIMQLNTGVKVSVTVLEDHEPKDSEQDSCEDIIERLDPNILKEEFTHHILYEKIAVLPVGEVEFQTFVDSLKLLQTNGKKTTPLWKSVQSALQDTTRGVSINIDRFITKMINESLALNLRTSEYPQFKLEIDNIDDLDDVFGGAWNKGIIKFDNWETILESLVEGTLQEIFLSDRMIVSSNKSFAPLVLRSKEIRSIDVKGYTKYDLVNMTKEERDDYLAKISSKYTVFLFKRGYILTNALSPENMSTDIFMPSMTMSPNEVVMWMSVNLKAILRGQNRRMRKMFFVQPSEDKSTHRIIGERDVVFVDNERVNLYRSLT